MTPIEYMKLPLQRYAKFDGRADRPEYWWFALLEFIAIFVFGAASELPFIGGLMAFVGVIVLLALFVPALAVSFRRLHDTDRSAWWVLIGLIPLVGGLVLLVFCCLPGTKGPNRFGDDPKAPLDKVVETF